MFAASFGVFRSGNGRFFNGRSGFAFGRTFTGGFFRCFLAGFLGLFGGCRAFLFICFFGDMSGSRTLLACFEAWAIGVKGRVVKSKAQSVIEIRFIRATERPSVKAGLSCLRLIYKT